MCLQRAFDCEGAYAAQLLVSLWSSLWSQEHPCWCGGSAGQPDRRVKTPESCSSLRWVPLQRHVLTIPDIFFCYIPTLVTSSSSLDQEWSRLKRTTKLVEPTTENLAGVASSSCPPSSSGGGKRDRSKVNPPFFQYKPTSGLHYRNGSLNGWIKVCGWKEILAAGSSASESFKSLTCLDVGIKIKPSRKPEIWSWQLHSFENTKMEKHSARSSFIVFHEYLGSFEAKKGREVCCLEPRLWIRFHPRSIWSQTWSFVSPNCKPHRIPLFQFALILGQSVPSNQCADCGLWTRFWISTHMIKDPIYIHRSIDDFLAALDI